jgi:hypothetical protein
VYQKTMFYTFEERFEAVLELLTYSKSLCEDIIKGAHVRIIVHEDSRITCKEFVKTSYEQKYWESLRALISHFLCYVTASPGTVAPVRLSNQYNSRYVKTSFLSWCTASANSECKFFLLAVNDCRHIFYAP